MTRQGYIYGAYTLQQFLWADPDHQARVGAFSPSFPLPILIPTRLAISCSPVSAGSAPGRADDRWGIAWCDYLFSRELKRRSCRRRAKEINDERVLEAYYDASIAPHLRLGPDVQLIWPGTPGKLTALFLGLRGRVVF